MTTWRNETTPANGGRSTLTSDGDGTVTQHGDNAPLSVRVCVECAQHRTPPHRFVCDECSREFVAAVRRRREAELRLPPLAVAS